MSISPAENPSELPPESIDERPTLVRWLMFALACGASWFLYLHRYTWNVIAPYLEQDFGLSKTEL